MMYEDEVDEAQEEEEAEVEDLSQIVAQRLETLCAMFPWAERNLVLVVLEGTSYDLDDAANGLLSIGDASACEALEFPL